MPRYRYKCLDCFGAFELVQKMDEAAVEKCYLTVSGEIGGEDAVRCLGRVKRVPSLGGFSLKGKGWYRDGY